MAILVVLFYGFGHVESLEVYARLALLIAVTRVLQLLPLHHLLVGVEAGVGGLLRLWLLLYRTAEIRLIQPMGRCTQCIGCGGQVGCAGYTAILPVTIPVIRNQCCLLAVPVDRHPGGEVGVGGFVEGFQILRSRLELRMIHLLLLGLFQQAYGFNYAFNLCFFLRFVADFVL